MCPSQDTLIELIAPVDLINTLSNFEMMNIFSFQTTAIGSLFVLLLIVYNSEEAIIKSLDLNKVKHIRKNSDKNRESLMEIETKAASDILGMIGITDPNLARVSDLAEFLLSIVANICTVWGFTQKQIYNRQKEINDKNKETMRLNSKQWSSTLDVLNSGMEDIERSLQELNCRLDSKVIENKGVISQECLKFVRTLVLPSPRILSPKQTSLLKKNDIASTSQYWLRV